MYSMLINSLLAKNLLKYHKLKVTDIPEKGVITIAGLNESGKTSIGEAICFALFGRTFFLDGENLHKIICWGRDTAEVTLKFSVVSSLGSYEYYKLYRSFDRKGIHKVSLSKEIAKDVSDLSYITLDTEEKVSNALTKILGFDYDAFSNSFYLAQRELTTPDPDSGIIKQMAGISDYAGISDELKLSTEKHKQKVIELSPEAETTETALDAIAIDETWLPELVDAEMTLGDEQQRREALMGDLDRNEKDYEDNINSYHSIRRSRGFWKYLSFLLFPIMLIAWALWGVYKSKPDFYEELIINFLGIDELSRTMTITNNLLLPIAIISTVLFFISFLLKKKATSTIELLHEEAEDISHSMREGHRFITTQVETLLPERVVQLFQERKKDESTLLIIPPREQFTNLSQLIEDMPSYRANAEEVSLAITKLSNSLKSQDIEIVDLARDLLDDVEHERLRSDDAGSLRSTLKVLVRAIDNHQHEIDVQDTSVSLLQRAASGSIKLFNKNIAEISAIALPQFTEGRYSEIRIAEDLSVQVYSDDKKDYMDFDEISSGTQRQIMLALRMAMSEELAKNSGNDQQFIFLDEPFAFFDQARTKSTLKALPNISNVITQIWVVSQEFPKDVNVDKVIDCAVDSAELVA